jgi:hypothetical protein
MLMQKFTNHGNELRSSIVLLISTVDHTSPIYLLDKIGDQWNYYPFSAVSEAKTHNKSISIFIYSLI